MLDFVFRCLKHPFDYLSALSRYKITFMGEKEEGNGVFSFYFTLPKHNFRWKAGQHGVFSFFDRKIKDKTWRAFSISSSAREGQIKITTNIPETPSDFKINLKTLKPGQQISIRGPFGEFHTKYSSDTIVGVAGGVGITPFRSIAYEISKNLDKTKLHLIYAGKNGFFTFKNEFEVFNQHPNINIIFVDTPEEVNERLEMLVAEYKNDASYYISGSPGMITALKEKLKTLGIKKIVNDPFKGY